MKVDNVSIFVGQDSQNSRGLLLGLNQKEGNSSPFFAGALNNNVDPIAQKKQMAQKQAMKVVGNAFAADRKIDMEMADREARIREMRAENLEAKNALNELEVQKKDIGREYGLGEEGLSDEDWNILEKGKKTPMLMSDEEKARYQEMEEQGLTGSIMTVARILMTWRTFIRIPLMRIPKRSRVMRRPIRRYIRPVWICARAIL